jgi:bacterioferritin-associated ferredoxin
VIHFCSSAAGTSISIQELLMILGTNCGRCGEMLRNLIHRIRTASWQYITLFAVPLDLNVRAASSFAETFVFESVLACLAKCSPSRLRAHP